MALNSVNGIQHQPQIIVQGPCWETANTKQQLHKRTRTLEQKCYQGFLLEKQGERLRKTEDIDYATLNDRIVMQAIESAGYEMNKELTAQLIQGKFDRAKKMLEKRDKQVDWHTEA